MTNRRNLVKSLVLGLCLIVPTLLVVAGPFSPAPTARGKSAAAPITDQLNPEQLLAQELALTDSRVLSYTTGHRSEVFGVRQVGQHFPESSRACATAACWQVEIYIWDLDAAVTAIVNVDSAEVLDVLYLPGMHPGINKRVADLALDLAVNDSRVEEALGFRPSREGIIPMEVGLVDSVCMTGHLCISPSFEDSDRNFWVIIDMTTEEIVSIIWSDMNANIPGGSVLFVPEAGCPPPGSLQRAGWSVNYETTGTDGLRVYDVTYNDVTVLTSVKVAEWHADYGDWGYEDTPGCGGSGGGFPIYPYGNTVVSDLLDDQQNVIGFEVSQDFRMSSWGNSCNYRYDQHVQFFNDGRYRVVGGAYGRGCGPDPIYRPLVRIDVAVGGDDGDSFAIWDGAQWQTQATEAWWLQDGPYTPEGYKWMVSDQSGAGYYIEPGQGQFGDGGRGDEAYIYAVLHHANEGDTDLGVIGDCCLDSFEQGPHIFLDGESIANQNIVVWYVPQMLTEDNPPNYYCYTVTGEPNPETYPCFGGPMFVPVASGAPAEAAFSHNAPVDLGQPVSFSNSSTGTPPLTYEWDFGDGATSTDENPSHLYAAAGLYTVSLTASNAFGSDTVTADVEVLEVGQPASAAFSHNGPLELGQMAVFTNTSTGSDPLSYAWDFGDGATSTEENPTHLYGDTGSFKVTLAVTNDFGVDTATGQIEVTAAAAAASFSHNGPVLLGEAVLFNNTSTGTEPVSYEWDFADGSPVSNEVNPSHTYAALGSYTVTLTAVNEWGQPSTFTAEVEVVEVLTTYWGYLPYVEED